MNNRNSELHWRADIEGLRAVAILSVVADHAGLPFVEGGFVGVDIFFVLSGFLITGLLKRELSENGLIDFKAFYARRLQRLLPGLALMLVVTALAAAILLAPHEQISQSQTAPLAFLWLSNFHFGLANFGYFDPGSESNLYLHTWSLGVEEQFYLVWPLLLLWLFSSNAGTQFRQARLLAGLGGVFVVGLVLSLVLSVVSPLWAFYSMPSRSWQFALGALIYLFTNIAATASGPAETKLQNLRWLSGWSGILLILGSVIFLHERMTYPGGWALLPSAGAALVIFSGSAPQTAHGVSRLLMAAPMRFIGRVSYSWYLWHWPVLVLGGMLYPEAGYDFKIAMVLLSLVLATMAYAFVEQPVRSSGWLRAQPAYMLSGALAVMASGAVLGSTWGNAAAIWATRPEQIAYQQLRSDLPRVYSAGCDDWFNSARVRVCSFGENSAPNTAVMFGDSVGLQWFSALAPHYTREGWRLLVVTKSSCPMVDEPMFYERIGAEYVVCEQWRNAAVEFLINLKPQLVFMGSTATYDFSVDQWRDGSARILAPLAAAAERVYVIRGTPRLAFDGPGCLARKDWQPEFLAALSTCSSSQQTTPDQAVFDALHAAASHYNNVKVLDFNPLLCPGGKCQARIGDSVVFRDFQHIANRHVESLQQEVRNVIAEAK